MHACWVGFVLAGFLAAYRPARTCTGADSLGYLRIAVRGRQGQAYRYINVGVRVAREMGR